MKHVVLIVLAVITLCTRWIDAGGCMSTGKVSSVVIPVGGAREGFTIIVAPGTAAPEEGLTHHPLPVTADFKPLSPPRRKLYKKTSSSTVASTSTGGDDSASEADVLDDDDLSFEDFKHAWVNLRLFLTRLRSELFQFRMYYTSICRLSFKNKRSMLVYLNMCNSVFRKYYPATTRNAFNSTLAIEEAYTDVKDIFHTAIECASKHLRMGRITWPTTGYNLLFAFPQTDMKPIWGLKAPACPWCSRVAKRRGEKPSPHKNFDHNATTFDDECPDCHQSFLKRLYNDSADRRVHLEKLQAHCHEVAVRLHCIYPKLNVVFTQS